MEAQQIEAANDIVKITIDEQSVIRRSPQVEHELKVAIFDLVEDNTFQPVDGPSGPFHVHLGLEEDRLVFCLRDTDDQEKTRITLPVMSFRALIKEYFLICDSYYKAIKSASPTQIEAIDMGRRGLHNDGAELLSDRLSEKVTMDKDTARRLFTLICILHIRA